MKILKCKLCMGEVDIIGNEYAVNRKVKCRKCGVEPELKSSPEVVIIKRRSQLD